MKMRKTWFSYLLWLLYMAITGVLFATCIITVSVYTWGLNKYFAAAFVCLFFAGVAGVWLAGAKIIPYLLIKLPRDKHFANMWECFLAMCIFAGSVLYRIDYILHADITVERNMFYEMAQVTNERGIPNITHGASYIYTVLLSAVFSFMGNKMIAGIVLQLVLHVLAILFLYFAIRLLAGRVTALCVAAIIAVSPVFMKDMCSLTPQGLYLLLYATGLWLTGLYLRKLVKNGYRRKGSYIVFLLLGIYIGILSYLDIIGFTLLLFAGTCFVVIREKPCNPVGQNATNKNKNIYIGKQFAVVLAVSLLMTAGFIELDAMYSGQTFMNILAAWLQQYGNGMSMSYLVPGPDVQPAIGIGVCFLASLNVVGFLMRKRQKTDAWVLLLLALTAISVTGIGQMDYSTFATVIWGTFAGLGLRSMGEDANQKEKISSLETVQIEELKPDEDLEEIRIEEIIDEKINNAEIEKEEKKSIKFIENPLPLPKKHVKKEMNYGVDVPDEQMNYDVFSEEDDDFDI
ncbi:MAG: glycosyltransferase family 39 protein [Clostridiales bacterium]|nr:glycosyltransferase family 39 protein [Clostridiales bacterium]